MPWYDCIGHWSADVGSHDDGNRLGHRQHISAHQAHHDARAGGGTLDQNCRQDAHHEACSWTPKDQKTALDIYIHIHIHIHIHMYSNLTKEKQESSITTSVGFLVCHFLGWTFFLGPMFALFVSKFCEIFAGIRFFKNPRCVRDGPWSNKCD